MKDLLEKQLAANGVDSKILKFEMRHSGKQVDTIMYSGQGDMMFTIRIDKMERLLTLNIDGPYLALSGSQFKDKNFKKNAPLFSKQNDLLKFEGLLSKELGVDRSNLLPVLVRGMELSPYWTTTGRERVKHCESATDTLITDERIVECSIKSVVHEEQSEYQKIQILDTIDFGR